MMEHVGPQWAATMRLAGPQALFRTAINMLVGSTPTPREHVESLTVPRTLLYPAADEPRFDADRLTAAGIAAVAIPDSGHNIMIDNVDGFVRAVAATLRD